MELTWERLEICPPTKQCPPEKRSNPSSSRRACCRGRPGAPRPPRGRYPRASDSAAALHLPEPNPFIPSDFSLSCDAAGFAPQPLPTLLADTRALELWHKTDHAFRRPKTCLYINCVAPAAYFSPAHACLTRLFAKMLADELTEFACAARSNRRSSAASHPVAHAWSRAGCRARY